MTATVTLPLPEIFVAGRDSRQPVLPVFGSEEEARALLGLPGAHGEEAGWRARKTGAGELISVLSASGFSVGPCAGVEGIALDPPSEALAEPEVLGLLTISRRCFLDSLMGRGRPWFEGR